MSGFLPTGFQPRIIAGQVQLVLPSRVLTHPPPAVVLSEDSKSVTGQAELFSLVNEMGDIESVHRKGNYVQISVMVYVNNGRHIRPIYVNVHHSRGEGVFIADLTAGMETKVALFIDIAVRNSHSGTAKMKKVFDLIAVIVNQLQVTPDFGE